MNKKMQKITSILLSAGLMATVSTSAVFAAEVQTSVNVDDENLVYDDEMLENLNLNLNDMTEKQKNIFYKVLDEEVEKQNFKTNEEKQIFREAVIMLATQEKTIQDVRAFLPEYMGVTNKVMASTLNLTISMIVGGIGGGSVAAYVRSVGIKEARRIFTKTIKSRLIAWGAGAFSISVAKMVDWVLTYADFGTKIAEEWDANDAVPNNGWCDFY